MQKLANFYSVGRDPAGLLHPDKDMKCDLHDVTHFQHGPKPTCTGETTPLEWLLMTRQEAKWLSLILRGNRILNSSLEQNER
jgi:hypothetical protein